MSREANGDDQAVDLSQRGYSGMDGYSMGVAQQDLAEVDDGQ